jgi:hypothetical protein
MFPWQNGFGRKASTVAFVKSALNRQQFWNLKEDLVVAEDCPPSL